MQISERFFRLLIILLITFGLLSQGYVIRFFAMFVAIIFGGGASGGASMIWNEFSKIGNVFNNFVFGGATLAVIAALFSSKRYWLLAVLLATVIGGVVAVACPQIGDFIASFF